MAERFGGKYSPDATDGQTPRQGTGGHKFRNRRATRTNIFARILFFAPLPLLFAGIGEIGQGDPIGAVIELGMFALFMLSAWLLNEGIRAENAYLDRKIARPPGFPRKMASAILTGLAVGGTTWLAAGSGMFAGIMFGAVATAIQIFAFGVDPLRSKGLAGVDQFESDRVARAIDKAEILVREINEAAGRIGDRRLQSRVENLCASAREVFRTIENDPRDLPRARKFLTVYLRGARDATVKFADLYARNRDAGARADYEALLSDLETSFTAHREQLLLEDRSDLDVEIEVLRERLQREGLSA